MSTHLSFPRAVLLLTIVILLPSATALFPQQNNPFRVSFDYHVMKPHENMWVMALYNDTQLYYDNTLTGIYTSWTTLDAQSTTSTTTLPVSAKIHATKPIVITERGLSYTNNDIGTNSDDAGVWGSAGFSSAQLFTDFHLPHPLDTLYVFATESNTNLLIDAGNDATWDLNTTISPGNLYTYTSYNPGDRIKADKPIGGKIRSVYVTAGQQYYAGFTLRDAAGTDFYVGAPAQGDTYVVASYNNTVISVDVNNDGLVDDVYTIDNTDVQTITNTIPSTYIHSNKPVVITHDYYYAASDYLASDYIFPAQSLASSHVVLHPLYSDIVVVPVEDGTNLLIDTDLDGQWDTNTTIESGVSTTFTPPAGSRMKSDKPIMGFQRGERFTGGVAEDVWGTVLPAATLAMTSDVTSSPADMEALVNIASKIWNMNEPVYNISVHGSINMNFTPFPDTANLNITVETYYANDTQKNASEEFQVALTGSGPYNYSFDWDDTTQLETLNRDEYILFSYQATTPNAAGTYLFDTFTVEVARATTWQYDWE